MSRIPVTKTPKAYVGGAFIRSESGRVFPLNRADGTFFANIPQCTRKDLRNAIEAAAKAGPGWARRTPYNRGQILYRLAEMLESRAGEMAAALCITPDGSMSNAAREVEAAVDRLIHYAGWADKYEQLLGNTNPVAGPFFNFTVAEPMGVIGVMAGDASPLLGFLSQIAPIIVAGSTTVALASESAPYPAILLGEMLATSDLPGGVVNLLTGFRTELISTFATHAHLRGVDAVVDQKAHVQLETGAADSIKRVRVRLPDEASASYWLSDDAQGLYEIRNFVEFKTVWHPVGA